MSTAALEALPPYRVRTHNASEHSENRMHSDDVARQFGFEGALVPGVTLFAHMTRPLVERHGEAWVGNAIAEVSFSKPAYQGDALTVRTSVDAHAQGYALTCTNEEGVELARMMAQIPSVRPAVDPRADIAPSAPIRERPIVSWALMEIGKPFPALAWAPARADNVHWCDDVRDDLALYREGASPPLHPGLVLRQANFALRNRFAIPAWIHTGSRIVFHEVLRVGPAYEVRAIPEEKWQRKGHELVRLYVAIRAGGRTLAEVMHTAIFNPRRAGERPPA
ncbi:MAG: MaoC family dehydratase [Burkholderiales bacterium]|nr:MaoC family dehydratase [Burkholderiales bacterium]